MRHSRRIALIAAALAAAGGLAGEEFLSAAGALRIGDALRGSVAPVGSLRAGAAGSQPGAPPRGDSAAEGSAERGWPAATRAELRGGAPAFPPDAAQARAASGSPRLARPSVGRGAVTARVTGFDPGAPRNLTLWRVGREGSARLAKTRSDASGSFTFGEVAVVESELAVTAEGARPEAADERVRLAALSPPAIVAERLVVAGRSWLRVWPSSSASRVIVERAGSEIARIAVAEWPAARERLVSLPLGAAEATGTLFVTEEDALGRRSVWQRIDAAP